jgi:mRNA interferase MazF
MEKGEVWWATLPDAIGSGPGGRRPVVIVSDGSFTQTYAASLLTLNLVPFLSICHRS